MNGRFPTCELCLLVLALSCGGRVEPAAVGPASVHPRDKVLRAATSADGNSWTAEPQVLARGGSSPCLALVEGRPVVFFVQDGESLRSVGLDGSSARAVEVEGAEPGLSVDPHVVAVEGGYRLYYLHAAGGDPGAGSVNEIHSARSADGLSWQREPGVRWRGRAVDPDVVALPHGGWRMFLTSGAREVVSARSDDGLAWQDEPGVRLSGGGVTSTVKVADGWWMFLHRPTDWPPRVYRAVSSDGLAFAAGPAVLEGAESPSVARVGGTWRMAFSSPPAPPGSGRP